MFAFLEKNLIYDNSISVVELITWYNRNSLKECFSGLDTYLRFSIGELSIVEAQYEFSPAQSDRNMLSLVPGDKITIIGRFYIYNIKKK